jgi:two-component system LytT family response regulator
MNIRVLIVDDEQLARRSIQGFLLDHDEAEVVAECFNGSTAVEAIERHRPDLVFLDMQMPGMTGLDVVSAIGEERMPATVFITAYDKYAVQAFDAHAVDYVLKPFGKDRFNKAFARALERIKRAPAESHQPEWREALRKLCRQEEYLERIAVPSNGRVTFVRVEDVSYFEAERNSVRIRAGKHEFEIRDSLTSLEQKLDPKYFLRIHRSTIVHLRKVKEIHPWFNGFHVVVLEDGRQLRMSRYQHEGLKRLLGNQ